MDFDRDLDLLAEAGEHSHQPVDGEAVELGLADAGEVRGRDAGQLVRRADRQLVVIQHADDTRGEQRPQLLAVGVGVAEVAEDVAAASNDVVVVIAHRSLSLSRFSRHGSGRSPPSAS
jgi:hypothetical protein